MDTIVAPDTERGSILQTPYKGFAPYAEEDWEIFFGRRKEQKVVTANLRSSRLTLLYGASGVGKTSILRAGAVHHLRELAARERPADGDLDFAVVYFAGWSNWNEDPVAGIVEAARAAVAEQCGVELSKSDTARPLDEELARFAEHVHTILLILDQFESYFVYNPGGTGPDRLAEELPQVVNTPGFPVNVLISVREDALARLDRFKGRIPSLFDNYLRLGHLQSEAAAEAIRGPIAHLNVSLGPREKAYVVEDELVDEVLDGVRADRLAIGQSGRGIVAEADGHSAHASIETAYLQLVMQRLWEEERDEPERTLRKATLDRLGGPRTIGLTHVRDRLDALPPDEQPIAAKIFDRLVTPSGTKIAQRDTDLAEWAGVPLEQLAPLLERLSSQDVRILRAIAQPEDQPSDVRHELFHDVLVSGILEWSRRYVEREVARREAERREQRARRLRLAGGLLGVFVVAITLLAGWALRETKHAEATAAAVRANALAAQAVTQLAGRPGDAVDEARKAVLEKETPETDDSLRTTLARLRLEHLISIPSLASESAAISPTGDLIVLTGAGFAHWRLPSGRSGTSLPGKHRFTAVAVSPDGRYVATSDQTPGGRVRLWLVASGRASTTLSEPRSWLLPTTLAFSADGQHVAGLGSGRIVVWDVRHAERPADFGVSPDTSVIALSPDGKRVAMSGLDGTVRVWKVATGQQLAKLSGNGIAASSVGFSPDGATVAVGKDDGGVRVWRLRDRPRVPLALRGNAGKVRALAFSPDGRLLVTAGDDGTARLWRAATKQGLTRRWDLATRALPIAVLRGDDSGVYTATFSADSGSVFTASADGTARTWTVANRVDRLVLKQRWPDNQILATSADGRLVLTKTPEGAIRAWQTGPKHRAPLFMRRSASRTLSLSAAFGGDGRVLATLVGDGFVRLWRASTGALIGKLAARTPAGAALEVAFSSDGEHIAAPLDNGAVLVWDLRRDSPPVVVQKPGIVASSVALSSDGDLLATINLDGAVRIWRMGSGRLLRVLPDRSATSVAFSPDGASVAVAELTGGVRIWQWAVRSGLPLVLTGHTDSVNAVAFSPDGKLLATASSDGTARLWGATTGASIGVVAANGVGLSGAVFSPDGRQIVLSDADGGIEIRSCFVCGPRDNLLQLAAQRWPTASTRG